MFQFGFRLMIGILLTLAAVPASAQAPRGRRQPAPPAAAKLGGAGQFPAATVKVGTSARVFRLVVPKSVDLRKPAPLVIAFHGILIDSKDLMPRYTGLSETAEAHKFIIAYPDAIDRSWGLSPEKIEADLAMFDALLVELKSHYKIDPQRIYIVGMSNGGYFAHLLARERSRTIAAVASHSGPLGLQTLLGVRADRKFPVLIIHGDQDKIFPVAFAQENRDKYTREGHEVKYVEVPKLGHMWATEAKINETIWEFFEKHPLPKP